jgi:hypothetical protein
MTNLTPADIADIEEMSREELIEHAKLSLELGGAVIDVLDAARGMSMTDLLQAGSFAEIDEALMRLHMVWTGDDGGADPFTASQHCPFAAVLH